MEKIIVALDLTAVSVSAVKYALKFKETTQCEIIYVHVTDDEDEKKVRSEVERFLIPHTPFNQNDIYIVKGNYRTEISRVAELMRCDLVIMATHGEKGAQRLLGSHALKVIADSSVPFVVIQEGTNFKPIQNIALTIDLEQESVQIIKHAKKLAMVFGAKVHLVGGQHNDSRLVNKVKTNIAVCLRQLKEEGVEACHVLLDRKNFDSNLIQYCQESSIDLLAASYYQQKLFAFSDRFVQNLLVNNLNLPIITIEANSTTKSGQYSFLSI